MAKWVCPVCGYVHEGDTPPEKCPICNVPGEKFTLQAEEKTWAAEHIVGVGKVFGEGVPENVREEIISGLRANFEGECEASGHKFWGRAFFNICYKFITPIGMAFVLYAQITDFFG